jgi:hypothetical protein
MFEQDMGFVWMKQREEKTKTRKKVKRSEDLEFIKGNAKIVELAGR